MFALPRFATGALFMNPWVLLVVAAALATSHGYVYFKGKSEGKEAVQVKWDAANNKTIRQAEIKTAEIQNAIKELGDAGDKREEALRAQLAATQRVLSSRPANRLPPTASVQCGSTEGPVPTGATGAQLARPDAGFLNGYSTDAAILASKLRTCIDEYAVARDKVNQFEAAQKKLLTK